MEFLQKIQIEKCADGKTVVLANKIEVDGLVFGMCLLDESHHQLDTQIMTPAPSPTELKTVSFESFKGIFHYRI